MASIKCYAIRIAWWWACYTLKSKSMLLCVTKQRVKIQSLLYYYYHQVTVSELSSTAAKQSSGKHLAPIHDETICSLYWCHHSWWMCFHTVCFTMSSFKADFYSNNYLWAVHFTVHAVTHVMMIVIYQL